MPSRLRPAPPYRSPCPSPLEGRFICHCNLIDDARSAKPPSLPQDLSLTCPLVSSSFFWRRIRLSAAADFFGGRMPRGWLHKDRVIPIGRPKPAQACL